MSLFFAAFGLMGFAKMGALIKHTVVSGGGSGPGGVGSPMGLLLALTHAS